MCSQKNMQKDIELDNKQGGDMHPDLAKVLYTKEQLQECVKNIGEQITNDYAHLQEPLVVISVLRGACIFMADIVREIKIPVEMDFMAVSSYGAGTTSSGVVRIVKDLSTQIENRDVLIIEDILDSGLTLKYLMKTLLARHPASLEVAPLLLKEGMQKADIKCKYKGFVCPNEFVVGYGLDYDQKYRNLPYIGVLKPEVYV